MEAELQDKIYQAETLIIENGMLLEILRGYCNDIIYADFIVNIITALDIILENQKKAVEITGECQQYFV